jgi:hypothetical protein
MASIILSSAGSALGGSMAGSLGAALGQVAGSMAGRFIDYKLFGRVNNSISSSAGSSLKDLSVQTATYGIMIPVIYGTVKVAGNIIWALPIREEKSTQSFVSSMGKGGRHTHTRTDYSYFASFAVSISEGEIDEITKIYANNRQLYTARYNIRIHRGTEDQLPDSLIEKILGVGKTPAYRGQAYVVFDDLPLAEFGNQIPNLNFEVKRSVKTSLGAMAEDLIESIVLIPGSGEFVYDTKTQFKMLGSVEDEVWYQRGKARTINQHNGHNKANAVLALDQLKTTLPNIKQIALVTTWFATSLNAGDASILPGVEYQDNTTVTTPDIWRVGDYSRHTAHGITKVDDRPIYGGTTNDASVIRYLEEIRTRNLKIMFYPMFFVDRTDKPWRGRLSGDPESIKHFFNKANDGYNRFILHYANLVKGKVDAFVIGSELIGLTKVKDEHNKFPAVTELCKLAVQVKEILGSEITVTYAADWSEYHHTDGGWYNLDELWACDAIDIVGIDVYFPITDNMNSVYDIKEIMKGWDSGEGYDYYLDNGIRSEKRNLDAPYAWKNIRWWWENHHTNPNGELTPWIPKSKKIWFTEYGYPSVDCCTNQPNVFYDPTSKESNFPIYSKGQVDFKAQRMAITAAELRWRNSDMVENKFLWTWDARPYPYWPDLRGVWGDGASWLRGHWVQGKLGNSMLSSVLSSLCYKAGLKAEHFETSQLTDNIEGMVIDHKCSVRSIIEMLQKAYFFEIAEYEGKINFVPKSTNIIAEIDESSLIPEKNKGNLLIRRTQELELPKKVDINFINRNKDFQVDNQHASRQATESSEQMTLDMPIVMDDASAKQIAETTLYNLWQARTCYQFNLSTEYSYLKPSDLISVKSNIIRITNVTFGGNKMLKISGVAEHIGIYRQNADYYQSDDTEVFQPIPKTKLSILDLPNLPGESDTKNPYLFFAACGESFNWKGATVFFSYKENEGFEPMFSIDDTAVTGTCISRLLEGSPHTIDYKNQVIVNLIDGELQSVTNEELLEGANMCIIGDEILHFQNAKLIDGYQYKLSVLVRGRQSTECFITGHKPGDRFIMINDSLKKHIMPMDSIGKKYYLKAVTYEDTLSSAETISFTFQGNHLRPFSPVNVVVQSVEDNKTSISWTRRSRISGKFFDYSDVPMGESKEQYLVSYMDINNTPQQTIVESITNISVEHHLNNAKVRQISDSAGLGF